MGQITSVDEFNRRRLMKAQSGATLVTIPPNSMAVLKRQPMFQLMELIFDNKLVFAQSMMNESVKARLNQTSFWTFPHDPDRTHFLTPAHLARTGKMARMLYDNGARFDVQATNGALPVHYHSQYAIDKGLLSFYANVVKQDTNRGGWPLRLNGQPYTEFDAPLITAIKAGNVNAVEGFCELDHLRINLNATDKTSGYTALMLAVARCEGLLQTHGADDPKTNRLLTILETLCINPYVDHMIRTFEGIRAEDMACHPETRKYFYRGLNNRPSVRLDLPDIRFTLD